MKKSPEKKSLVDKIKSGLEKIPKSIKVVGATALLAIPVLLGTNTGCRPNKQDDLKKIENTTKSDSLAYNHNSPDSLAYSDDVKNYLQLTEEDWNSLSDEDKAGFLQGIIGMKEDDKTIAEQNKTLAEQNGIKKDQKKIIAAYEDSVRQDKAILENLNK